MLSATRLAAKQRAARGSPLRPPTKGSSEEGCRCSGHVQEVLKDGSAWLLPHHQIDHPSVERHSGSIFMPAESLALGRQLAEGDQVVFDLVVDTVSSELSAEQCRLKRDVVVRMRDAPLWLLDDSDDEDALLDRNLGFSSSSSTAGSTSAGDVVSEQESLSDCEDEPDCEPEEPESEPDNGLPSIGAALHAEGLCKPCTFFMWGCCTNGEACTKCHHPRHVSCFNCGKDEN
eukprot:TRINITY_DN114296_c0_g1_i1.p1 TRINITY_DN114296_c0_g1~~TRINITY_DN114296_c0_g1_i1.p1  ORF type:complete len:231 (-),score=31.03 TRINITY_DN114296_c0_g1_i1:414-1106(-)